MAISVDDLEIEISTSAQSAVQHINDLTQALETLRKETLSKWGDISGAFANIQKNINPSQLGDLSGASKKIRDTADAIEKLNSASNKKRGNLSETLDALKGIDASIEDFKEYGQSSDSVTQSLENAGESANQMASSAVGMAQNYEQEIENIIKSTSKGEAQMRYIDARIENLKQNLLELYKQGEDEALPAKKFFADIAKLQGQYDKLAASESDANRLSEDFTAQIESMVKGTSKEELQLRLLGAQIEEVTNQLKELFAQGKGESSTALKAFQKLGTLQEQYKQLSSAEQTAGKATENFRGKIDEIISGATQEDLKLRSLRAQMEQITDELNAMFQQGKGEELPVVKSLEKLSKLRSQYDQIVQAERDAEKSSKDFSVQIESLSNGTTKEEAQLRLLKSQIAAVTEELNRLFQQGKNADDLPAAKALSKLKDLREQYDKLIQSENEANEATENFTTQIDQIVDSTTKEELQLQRLAKEIANTTEALNQMFQQGKGGDISALKSLEQLRGLKEEYAALKHQTGLTDYLDKNANAIADFAPGGRNTESKLSGLKNAFAALVKPITSSYLAALKFERVIGGLLVSKIKTLTASLIKLSKNLITAPFRKIGESVSNASKQFGLLIRAIGRIAVYRAIRRAIQIVTQGLTEGINNLYQYSMIVDTQFHKSMDTLATDALYVKNAFASIAGPIIDTLAPAIDFLADQVAAVFDRIAMFMAAISGKSTYSSAVKSATQYAEAVEGVGEAAEEAARGLLKIDELTILQDTAKATDKSSIVPSPGEMFVEKDVDPGLMDLAGKVRKMVEDGDWEGIGAWLAEKLNKLIDDIDWEGLGEKFGKGIQSIIDFALGFLRESDFTGLGEKLAAFVNNAIEHIDFYELGELFVRGFTSMIDLLIGFLTGLNPALIGGKVRDFLNGAIDAMQEWLRAKEWDDIGRKLGILINEIIQNIYIALRTHKWGLFGQSLAELLNGAMEGMNFETLGRTAIKIPTIILDEIISFIEHLDFGLLGESISDFIKGALHEATEWLTRTDFEKLGNSIATGISDFVRELDVDGLVTAFLEFINSALGAGAEFLSGIDAGQVAYDISKAISDALTNIENWKLLGKGLLAAFSLAFLALPSMLLEAGFGVFEALFDSLAESFEEGGHELPAGLLRGMANGLNGAREWLHKNFTDKILGWVKKLFGIASPSKEFKAIGENLVGGLNKGLSEKWEIVTTFFSEKWTGLKTGFGQTWDDIKSGIGPKWEAIKTTLSNSWNGVQETAGAYFGGVVSTIASKWDEVKTGVEQKWPDVNTSLDKEWQGIQTTAEKDFGDIEKTISDAWEGSSTTAIGEAQKLRQNVEPELNAVEKTNTDTTQSIMDKMKGRWTESVKEAIKQAQNLASTVSKALTGMRDTVVGVWEKVSSAAETAFNTAKKVAGDIASNISGAVSNITSDLTNVVDKATESFSGVSKSMDEVSHSSETLNKAQTKTTKSSNVRTSTARYYASGGIVQSGQMFVARENGLPEYVGKFGSQTAVANNEQIVEGVASGVKQGVEEANGDVVNTIYAAAMQIVNAIKDNGGTGASGGVNWNSAADVITRIQNRQARMSGKPVTY